jgi:hypothetical protein
VSEWTRAELAFDHGTSNLVMIGCWHPKTHSRDGAPSTADLTAWLAALDLHMERGCGAAYSVGLIYSASEYYGQSWARPGVHCFVTGREGYGRHSVTEPAAIRERR